MSKHKRNEKINAKLTAAVNESVEAAVSFKLADIEKVIYQRLISRSDNPLSHCNPPQQPSRRFCNPEAGP
jgi:hypothetical protein